jgi:uncharacterized BrkB/YihY/UPF0761 family membrane protein
LHRWRPIERCRFNPDDFVCALLPVCAKPEERKWDWRLPGTIAGALLWTGATIGMRSYFDEFASYQQIHGRVAPRGDGLMWLYLTSAAVLIGGLNSEIEKGREASGAERKERNEVPDDAPH